MTNLRFGPYRPALRAVAALLVGLLAAPPAWAATGSGNPTLRPSLVIAAFPLDDASAVAAARVAWVGEQAARRVPGFDFQDLSRLLDPAGYRAREAKATEARAAYDSARKSYDELEVQKAAEDCDRSLRAWEKADLTRHLDSLVAAWTLRIAALLANAQTKAAMAELNLLLPVGAKAVFDPNAFTPDFLAQVRAKREDFAKRGELSAQVVSKPVPARVFVDGTYRGITPVEVKGLSPGDHFVTFVAPGYAQLQKRMRGGPGAVEKGLLEPTGKLGGYLGKLDQFKLELRNPIRGAAGRALAQELAVDQVLAVAVQQQEKAVRVLAVRVAGLDGKDLSVVDELIPDDAGFETAVEDVLTRAITTQARLGARAGAPKAEGFSWNLRHTGFLLMGLGVGAGGAGLGCGLKAQSVASDYQTLRDVPQVNTEVWSARESEGRQFALAADIAYGAAILLAVTGVVLAIVGGGRDEEPVRPEGQPLLGAAPPLRLSDKKQGDEKRKADERQADERRQADEDAKRKADDERKADERRKADEDAKRKADDERKADERRKADEDAKRKADDQRKADEDAGRKEADRKAEEKRRAEDDRKDAKRKAEEEKARKAEEKRQAAEEKKRAEEERKAEEKRRVAEEKERKAEEKRKAAEEKKRAEEDRKADEKRRADEEKERKAEEKRKAAEEKKRAEEDQRTAEERKKAEEEQRRLADEKRAEEQRSAEERRKAEEARAAEEKRKAEEQRREEEKKRREVIGDDDLRDDR